MPNHCRLVASFMLEKPLILLLIYHLSYNNIIIAVHVMYKVVYISYNIITNVQKCECYVCTTITH